MMFNLILEIKEMIILGVNANRFRMNLFLLFDLMLVRVCFVCAVSNDLNK